MPEAISRWWIAGLAAVVAFGAILSLLAIVLAVAFLAPPAVWSSAALPPRELAAFVVLGVLAPVLVYSPALAALLAALAAPLVRSREPAWRLPVLLALAAGLAVLVPTVQSIGFVQDTLLGVVAGGRSELGPGVWRQTWPLTPLTLLVSVLLGWKAAALALGIPMLSLHRWAEPIEIGARRRAP